MKFSFYTTVFASLYVVMQTPSSSGSEENLIIDKLLDLNLNFSDEDDSDEESSKESKLYLKHLGKEISKEEKDQVDFFDKIYKVVKTFGSNGYNNA